MPITGQKCERSGVYRSGCCKQDIPRSKGAAFPDCPRCLRPTEWVAVALLSDAIVPREKRPERLR